jgi:predicted ATPase/DNA-binding SARP family transcriptional activator
VANPAHAASEYRLLGPVEVLRQGRPLQLGGRRQRTLLALLLLEPGRPVATDRLIDELWRETPPPGAERTLRVYVSRLRASLGQDRLVARPSGYVLEVESDQLDVVRFERLLDEGREALARGAAGLAADRLGAALALWRGPALADVEDSGILALEASRLDELRLACVEERIEAELSLGRHDAVVPELERLVGDEPLRERLWRQLVIALYRSGREADALAAYRRARTFLSEKLGLEPSEELRALERAVLRQEIARPEPAEERHNLPAQLTSFVGREKELGELEGLLREHRLVTLTGVGGAGKTRLALELVAGQVGAWRGGIWLVDMTAHVDSARVPNAVAQALGVAERPHVSALDGLLDHLRGEELLLVIDNCEHLATACAELAHDVLRACGHVRVLATSRIALGVSGEVDYTVEPLPTPTDDVPTGEVEQFAAVRLFLARGRAARRDLAVDDTGAMTVARICRELDGLPLAIELAAARAKALSLDEIASRLDDRFRFLRSSDRTADPRHQTLRTTIDWSYDLLSDDERALLEGLSVFAGGFSLAAVSAICLDGDEPRALELVEQLVACSLVVAADLEGATRYRLLDTILEYAAERLEGDADLLRRRHAEHFLDVARRAGPDYVRFASEEQRAGLAILDTERENMDAALRWAIANEPGLALELAIELRHYWLIRGYLRQGLNWLDEALACAPPDPSSRRVEGLAAAALLARLTGEFQRARTFAEEGVAAAHENESGRAVVTCHNVLTTLTGLAGDYEGARAHCDEAVRVARNLGSGRLEAIALFILAEVALHMRRYGDLQEIGERSLELSRAIDDQEGIALVLSRLGMGAAHAARLEEARGQLGDALELATGLGFPGIAANCCYGLALVAAGWGDAGRGARLVGAADELLRASGFLLLPAEADARENALAAVHESLSAEDVAAALDQGHRLALDELLTEGRSLAPPVTSL